jgi:hypothetical protein
LNYAELASAGSISPTNDIVVQIFNDIGGKPGTSLLTLVTPVFVNPTVTFYPIFTTPSPFILAAGTAYWVVATNTDPNPLHVLGWDGNYPPTAPSGIAAFNGALYTFGTTSNPTWVTALTPGMLIDASAVPEPASAGLFVLGTCVILTFGGLSSITRHADRARQPLI